jgi:hypothetical protein
VTEVPRGTQITPGGTGIAAAHRVSQQRTGSINCRNSQVRIFPFDSRQHYEEVIVSANGRTYTKTSELMGRQEKRLTFHVKYIR